MVWIGLFLLVVGFLVVASVAYMLGDTPGSRSSQAVFLVSVMAILIIGGSGMLFDAGFAGYPASCNQLSASTVYQFIGQSKDGETRYLILKDLGNGSVRMYRSDVELPILGNAIYFKLANKNGKEELVQYMPGQ